MPDIDRTIQPFPVTCVGGLLQNIDDLSTAQTRPGIATALVNFEPSLKGGYRRINGYTRYGLTAVPGQGKILGVKVTPFGVLAARQVSGASTSQLYYSTGTTWTALGSPRTGSGRYRFALYYINTIPFVAIVDGINVLARWDGTNFINISGAGTAPSVVEFYKGRLFAAQGTIVSFSAPGVDTDWTPGAGAGQFDVADKIQSLKSFRGELIVFCSNRIAQLTGSNLTDFAVSPITIQVGCMSGDTVQEFGGDLCYLSQDGVRQLGGTNRIGDFEISSISKSIQQLLASNSVAFANNDITSCLVRAKSQYRLFFGNSTTPTMTAGGVIGALVMGQSAAQGDMTLGPWSTEIEWSQLQGFAVSCCDSAYINNVETVVHGDYSGFVFQQESGTTLNGAAVTAIYTTPYFTYGQPELRKTLHSVKLSVELEGPSTLSISTVYDSGLVTPILAPTVLVPISGSIYVFDDGTSLFDSVAIFDSTAKFISRSRLQGSGFNSSLTFSCAGGAPFTIKSFVVEFVYGDRR